MYVRKVKKRIEDPVCTIIPAHKIIRSILKLSFTMSSDLLTLCKIVLLCYVRERRLFCHAQSGLVAAVVKASKMLDVKL